MAAGPLDYVAGLMGEALAVARDPAPRPRMLSSWSWCRAGPRSHGRPAPPDLPKGSQIAVLAGDPGKPGPFVLLYVNPEDSPAKPR